MWNLMKAQVQSPSLGLQLLTILRDLYMYCRNEATILTTISFVLGLDTQSMHAPTTTTPTIPIPNSIVWYMSFFTFLHFGFSFTVYSNKVCVTNRLFLLSLVPHFSFILAQPILCFHPSSFLSSLQFQVSSTQPFVHVCLWCLWCILSQHLQSIVIFMSLIPSLCFCLFFLISLYIPA